MHNKEKNINRDTIPFLAWVTYPNKAINKQAENKAFKNQKPTKTFSVETNFKADISIEKSASCQLYTDVPILNSSKKLCIKIKNIDQSR